MMKGEPALLEINVCSFFKNYYFKFLLCIGVHYVFRMNSALSLNPRVPYEKEMKRNMYPRMIFS